MPEIKMVWEEIKSVVKYYGDINKWVCYGGNTDQPSHTFVLANKTLDGVYRMFVDKCMEKGE